MSKLGELQAARSAGYRITVHRAFFPFERRTVDSTEIVHAVVDHGARAIFCSQEWLDGLPKETA